jgi:ATP-dependent RNA helicase RhlE
MKDGFESLGLCDELVRAVREKGYKSPTPIQREAIPFVLEGGDIMGGAQTGTGKTAAFTLPLLQRLYGGRHRPEHRTVRALVLTPTRELAAQVHESVCDYGKHLPFRAAVVFGGVSMSKQIAAFRSGVDIVVATPGRLLDHLRQGKLKLKAVEVLVLDEADRMLDMGFLPDIKKIMRELPEKRQSLLFSATFPDEIERLCKKLLKSPKSVHVARKSTAAEGVKQVAIPVSHENKHVLLSHLIRTEQWYQVLVFTRTKARANRLTQKLTQDGVHAVAIHGNKSQGARTRALAAFKSGEVQALVATDIAARGLDIDQLPHVVNFDLPNVPEDYVHRIGRTGRAGREGEAISLVSKKEFGFLAAIERLIKKKLPRRKVEGVAPAPEPEETEAGKPKEKPRPRKKPESKKAGTHAGGPPKKWRGLKEKRKRREAKKKGGDKTPVQSKDAASPAGAKGKRKKRSNKRRANYEWWRRRS